MSEPSAATASPDPPILSWKLWIAGSVGFLLATASVFWAARTAAGFERVEMLAGLLVYTSLACTFCPLPTAWIVLWAARSADPLAVAFTAAIGTCIANLHDYYIVNALCRAGWARKARGSRLHDDAVRWFHRAPFLTLTAASLLPLPIDFVRMLAISAGYPRRRYVLATFAGRFPRYLALAFLSWQLRLSNRAIAAVLVLTVVAGLFKAAQQARRRWSSRAKAAGDAR
jgi:membrane protein YqaA with SNARE-associated domain